MVRKFKDNELNKKSRLSTDDEFELVYMRHGYFTKSENPEPGRIEVFEEMIGNISNRIYFKNINTFKTLGMEVEDLVNICRVHTVSFVSMCGLKENPDRMEKFSKKHKSIYGQESEVSEKDIFTKECYDLCKFLKQRMTEMVTFSNKKNKNIIGSSYSRGYFIGDPSREPTDYDLINSPESFGYKKLTQKEYKRMVEECKAKGKSQFINKQKQMVRYVYMESKPLKKRDISYTLADPRNGSFYQNPEDTVLLKEDVLEKIVLNNNKNVIL